MKGREAQEQPVVESADWARMREQELVAIWMNVFRIELDRGTPIDELRSSVQNMHRSGTDAARGKFAVPQNLMHDYIQAWRSYQKHTGAIVPMQDLQLRALDELEQDRDTVEHGAGA